jgi:hypothetical protein
MEKLKAQYGEAEWTAMSKKERVALLHRDLSSSSDEDEKVASMSQQESAAADLLPGWQGEEPHSDDEGGEDNSVITAADQESSRDQMSSAALLAMYRVPVSTVEPSLEAEPEPKPALQSQPAADDSSTEYASSDDEVPWRTEFSDDDDGALAQAHAATAVTSYRGQTELVQYSLAELGFAAAKLGDGCPKALQVCQKISAGIGWQTWPAAIRLL